MKSSLALLAGAGALVAFGVILKGGTVQHLTASQIAYFARNAGFTGANLETAIAVALAESGGNPQAYNPETAAGTSPGEGSYGLWQVYLQAHPEFDGLNLYDPQTNANAAYSVFSASGWGAWSTFNSGAYQAHLGAARAALA